MLSPQFLLPVHTELVVDLFAGGGGASTGIEQAIGRHVDIAVNHDREAISLHTANHPQTRHFCSDVFEVDPLTVTEGQPVGLLWASPDCKHFSKAKGGKPVSKKIRSLAWVVVKWAKLAKPRVICLENVEEFQTWGPLGKDQRPCPERKGQTFQRWVAQLRGLGYKVEWRELRACDFGAPTIRKRLFLVARRDGLPIIWPQPTHAKPDAKGKVPADMKPWRTAADCIDWSIPAPSIFERSKPLADATCRRIAKGIMRYVVEAEQPFIVPEKSLRHLGARQSCDMVQAFLAKHYTGVVGHEVDKPAGTVTTVDHHSLVTAHLTKFRVGSVGTAMDEPVHTVTAGGTPKRPSTGNTMGLVTANLIHMGHGEGQCGTKRFSHGIRDVQDPLNTVTAQGAAAGVVQAFLVKYYGNDKDGQDLPDPLHTVPTRDRFGLVMVHGEPYAITDIGLRMLTPRELYRAQGFPDSYRIDTGAAGEPITKTAQVRMCGNSVCPPLARALVSVNYTEAAMLEQRKAA